MKRRYLLVLIGLLLLGGCSVGRGCRPDVEPPATVTPTVPAPPTIAATLTPTAVKTAAATRTPVAATSTPQMATMTPTAELTATVEPTGTPALLGQHRVRRGDTMWDVGLLWYAGRYFAWGEDVWRPICMANPEIADCRMIYPGDVLRIPKLP